MDKTLEVSDMPALTDEMHSKLRSLERHLCQELSACCSNYELLDPEAAFEYARTYAVKFFDCYYSFYSQYPKYYEYWRLASETHAFQRTAKCLKNSSPVRYHFESKPDLVKRIKKTVEEHSKTKEMFLLPPSAYAASGIDTSIPLVKMALAAAQTARPAVFAPLPPEPKRRFSGQIKSETAAQKVRAFIDKRGLSQTEFATRANTTDKTIRKFLRTGSIKRSILVEIAKAMGTTREELLS